MPTAMVSFPDNDYEYSPLKRRKPCHVGDCKGNNSPFTDYNTPKDLNSQQSYVVFSRIHSIFFNNNVPSSRHSKPVLDNKPKRRHRPFVAPVHLDNDQYSVGEDNGNSITFLPSLRNDNDGFQQAKPCVYKRKNGQTTPCDIHSKYVASTVCNASYIGSMGLSGLTIEPSFSPGHITSEPTGLPVKHVSDTTEEDKQLFESVVDDEGNTQLHLSIRDKDEDTTLEIIRKATEFDDLNVPNFLGQTALHLAVRSRQGRIVRMLMCAGAFVSVDDEEGNTPLHLACSLGDIDVVVHLTRPIDYKETRGNKYELPFTAIPQDVSVCNNNGETCLELAKQNGHDEIVTILSKC